MVVTFYPSAGGVVKSKRKLRMPSDYQYDDALPHQVVKPEILFGEIPHPDVENGESSTIDLYAQWMTSKENPRFSKVIANRMWKHIMGRGLIEPVDQLTAETQALSPELMDYQRCSSRHSTMTASRHSSASFPPPIPAPVDNRRPRPTIDYNLEGPVFKRDGKDDASSLATLMTPDIDRIQAPPYTGNFQRVRYKEGAPPNIVQLVDQLSTKNLIKYVENISPLYQEFLDARTNAAKLSSQGLDRSSPEMRQAQNALNQARKNWHKTRANGENNSLTEQPGMSSMQMSMSGMMSGQAKTSPTPTSRLKNGCVASGIPNSPRLPVRDTFWKSSDNPTAISSRTPIIRAISHKHSSL